jgi:predicted SnoaL-like aldol condensation-catalyzing enzyme
MHQEANKVIVHRYIEIWNTGNVARADAVLAPTYVDHAHPEVTSLESFRQALQRTRTAFPDFHITIDMLISEDDLVALRGTIRRTQQGKASISRVIWFVRISDGKMAELWTGVESSE